MSKLVDQLENAIKSADWVTVCAVFKKMTGRTVEPPKVGPPPFDWRTAKKADLYKFLQKKLGELDPVKEYTTEDLRSMVQLHSSDVEDESEDLLESISEPIKTSTRNVEYTYIPEGKTPLNIDKQKLRPVFKDFPTYNDEKTPPVDRSREKQVTYSAKCIKCNKMYDNIHPSLITKGALNGEKIFCCTNCGDSIRR